MLRIASQLAAWIILTVSFVACSSDAVPVAAPVDESPKSVVTMHPELADFLIIPNDNQAYSWTQDGLLKYTFQLQNNNARQVRVRVRATFYDQSGTEVAYGAAGELRRVLPPSSIEPFEFVCSNPRGKSVRVHVLPSR